METLEKKQTLREWREEAGFSQRELAELADITKGTMSHLEMGLVNLTSPSGRRVLAALEVDADAILPDDTLRQELKRRQAQWGTDGFSDTAPVKPLDWWRKKRKLSMSELAVLSGVSRTNLQAITYRRVTAVWPKTRAKLAGALLVSPDKLLLPGDERPERDAPGIEDLLRAELRGARRVVRRWHDVAKDGRYLTNRAYDDLAGLIEETEREL